MTRRIARALALVAAGVVAACHSPEASRARGGGAGADVGNRDVLVEMHGGSRMYYQTPCRMPRVECPGPLAVPGLATDFPPPRRPRERR